MKNVGRLIEDLKRLVQTPSVSQDGNEALANGLSSLMNARGIQTKLQQVFHSFEGVSKHQYNVVGILGDPLVDRKIRKGLLLSCHLDTVAPGKADQWTECQGQPYDVHVRDDRVYGLGVADSKLDFLCMLYAVLRFRERKLKEPVYLVGTCGEKLGSMGCKYLVESYQVNPRRVVVAAPTALRVGFAQKTLSVFKVKVSYQVVERDARGFNRRASLKIFGRNSHSAIPGQGENAVLKLIDVLHQAMDAGFEIQLSHLEGGDIVSQVPDQATADFFLTSHQFEDFKRFFKDLVRKNRMEGTHELTLGGLGDRGISFLPEDAFSSLVEVMGQFQSFVRELQENRDEHYDPPNATMNVGRIRQGRSFTEAWFDFRTMPDRDIHEVTQSLKQRVEDVSKHYPMLNLSMDLVRVTEGQDLGETHEFVQQCGEVMAEADLPPNLHKHSFASEAGRYTALGFDAVSFGLGDVRDQVYCPNESANLRDAEKTVSFYEKLIAQVCG